MSNTLHLNIINDGATYDRRRHLAFKNIEGSSTWAEYRSAIRALCVTAANSARETFGVRVTSAELKTCTDEVSAYMIAHAWECIDVKPETKIRAVVRRWHDDVCGNSYFSARVTVECADGHERAFLVPFQYGYGNQPEWEVLRECINHGLIETLEKYPTGGIKDAPWHLFSFEDQGYMKKSQRFGG
jgi:hypothetical protein